MAGPGVTELLKEAIIEMEEGFKAKSEDLQQEITKAYENSRSVGWFKKMSSLIHTEGAGKTIGKTALKMAIRAIFK